MRFCCSWLFYHISICTGLKQCGIAPVSAMLAVGADKKYEEKKNILQRFCDMQLLSMFILVGDEDDSGLAWALGYRSGSNMEKKHIEYFPWGDEEYLGVGTQADGTTWFLFRFKHCKLFQTNNHNIQIYYMKSVLVIFKTHFSIFISFGTLLLLHSYWLKV